MHVKETLKGHSALWNIATIYLLGSQKRHFRACRLSGIVSYRYHTSKKYYKATIKLWMYYLNQTNEIDWLDLFFQI